MGFPRSIEQTVFLSNARLGKCLLFHGFRRNKKRLRLPQLRNGLRLKMVVVIVGDKDQVRVVGGVRNLVRVKV